MFRSGWGGGCSRRRQAHEQGPAACGVLGDGGRGKTEAIPKKGFSRESLGCHSKCNRKERIGHRKALC